MQIWQHSWLPIKHPTRVLSPILEGWEEAIVEVLINVVDGLFVPEEATLIKKIPLSRHPTEDKLFWPCTQNGQYSCKSEYRFLKHKANKEVAEATQGEDRNFWFNIWALQVPNKIKNFMWRACRDSLPMKANLRRRHITDSPLCERCLREEESLLHVLWSCCELDSVWYGRNRSGTFTNIQTPQTNCYHGYSITKASRPFCDDDVGNMVLMKPSLSP